MLYRQAQSTNFERMLGELFQIVRAEDVRSLLLGHCTLSYFDLQEILQIEEHAEASVGSPVRYGNCKVCSPQKSRESRSDELIAG